MKTPWTNEQIDAVNAVLIPQGRGRQKPVTLPTSPHGFLPNGAADFRWFPLTQASGVVIADADFSHSRSPENEFGVDRSILFAWVHCERVIFDEARVFHRLNGRFMNCSFRRIGTDQCGVTGTFIDCDFTGTSFRNAHLTANFVRCKFHDCKMNVASWASSFEECEFRGASIDPLFPEVRDVALSADRVTFVVLTHKVHVNETRHIS